MTVVTTIVQNGSVRSPSEVRKLRNLKAARLTQEFLVEFLKGKQLLGVLPPGVIPEDAEPMFCTAEPEQGVFTIAIGHPSFDPVAEGAPIPLIDRPNIMGLAIKEYGYLERVLSAAKEVTALYRDETKTDFEPALSNLALAVESIQSPAPEQEPCATP